MVAAFADETSDLIRNPIYLAIGELIGAAIFINMVITSTITLRSDSQINMPKYNFAKDILFLILVLGLLLLYNMYGKIEAWMGFVFFGLYAMYFYKVNMRLAMFM